MMVPYKMPGETAYDILVGTKLHRPTAKPDLEIPDGDINILIPWGAKKVYGLFSSQQPCLMELLAIQRLISIRDSLKAIGKRVNFILFIEDFTEEVLSDGPSLDYIHGLVFLCRAYDIRWSLESNLIRDKWSYLKEVNSYSTYLYSDREMEIGWRGKIDWDYYISRARSEHPESNYNQLKVVVSKYLANSLARYRNHVHPKHDIKLSFSPYPPSVPKGMRKNRIEHKLKMSRNNRSMCPPWCCFTRYDEKLNWHTLNAVEFRCEDYKPYKAQTGSHSFVVWGGVYLSEFLERL